MAQMDRDTPVSFEPPRGMRDFYPEEMSWRNCVFDAWRRAATLSGFLSYDACVVESLELLQRKSGEEVTEQIYAFEDKSGRKLALRPEMTPTLARMVAARQGSLRFPLKWSTIAQCFRYERMTRGRKREHYQWNIDIVGESSVLAETEVLYTADNALKLMGMPQNAFKIHVNNRALLSELLSSLGFSAEQTPVVFLALDKRGKISDESIAELLCTEGLAKDSISKVFELMAIQTLDEAAELAPTDSLAVARLRELFELAGVFGFAESLLFDISVIRGLSYYTDIVFEAFDTAKKFRAIFGGGRYNNLLSSIGGAPMPAVGLGFGDVVITEVLKDLRGSDAQHCRSGVTIGYMFEAQRAVAIKLADGFRRKGTAADLSMTPSKPKNFFKHASESAFEFAVFIGPDDVAAGQVRLKNLQTREETVLNLL